MLISYEMSHIISRAYYLGLRTSELTFLWIAYISLFHYYLMNIVAALPADRRRSPLSTVLFINALFF